MTRTGSKLSGRELPVKSHYTKHPELQGDEELVEYREPSELKIRIFPGEIVVGTDGSRHPFISHYVNEGLFNAGGKGRYIVKKKNTGICEKCGEPYVFGYLAQHFETCTRTKEKKLYTRKIHSNNQEVVMADQKPLSYKRDTLIEALNAAVTENEKKRAEDKQKKLDKDKKAVDQLVELLKTNPHFATLAIEHAANLMGRHTSDVGSDAFKETVEKNYPSLEVPEVDPDSDLKKLIRVYEKAEDETVEVHVHDTVYNYL